MVQEAGRVLHIHIQAINNAVDNRGADARAAEALLVS